jgi:hypothetical protein
LSLYYFKRHHYSCKRLLLRLPAPTDNAATEAEPNKAEPPKRKRRRFQFRLRTLLIVVTLLAACCVPIGWLLKDRQRLIEERDDLIRHATADPFADNPSLYEDYKRYKSEAEQQRRRADMLEYTLSKQQPAAGQKR